MKNKPARFIAACVLTLLGVSAVPGYAYVGPGTGLSALGSFLALVAGVIIAILGFVWYPLKRLFGKRKKATPPEEKQE